MGPWALGMAAQSDVVWARRHSSAERSTDFRLAENIKTMECILQRKCAEKKSDLPLVETCPADCRRCSTYYSKLDGGAGDHDCCLPIKFRWM